jgi:hypothetical protein
VPVGRLRRLRRLAPDGTVCHCQPTRQTVMDYHGWANWETWNVSLWLQNEEPLYRHCVAFMERYKGEAPWRDLVAAGDLPMETPDGARLDDPLLSIQQLDRMLLELLS